MVLSPSRSVITPKNGFKNIQGIVKAVINNPMRSLETSSKLPILGRARATTRHPLRSTG